MLERGPAKRLTVTVNESSRWHGRSLYNALLELFQHKGLAGATVSRGIAGFTGHGAIHTINIVDLSSDLPVRIEIVDTAEAIDRVLPDVYDMVDKGLVEVQDTVVIKFATGEKPVALAAKKGELMRLIGKAKMLRVHIGEDDRWEGQPLYEAIVKRAAQLDIAGATVYRGILGYGAHRRIHRHKTIALSSDDPIMIAMVDEEEKINTMIAALETMVSGGCMIAISDVTVVKYLEHGDEKSTTVANASVNRK
jgi:PII-like signaling protein